jgi:hypothetical protein
MVREKITAQAIYEFPLCPHVKKDFCSHTDLYSLAARQGRQ